jgi:hypothetical protein
MLNTSSLPPIKHSSESPEKQQQQQNVSNSMQKNSTNHKSSLKNSSSNNNNKNSSSLNGSARNLKENVYNFSNSDLYDNSSNSSSSRLDQNNGGGSNYNLVSAIADDEEMLKKQMFQEEEVFDGLIFKDSVNSNQTLKMLNVLRKNRQLCDLILQLDDDTQDIYCHQIILACNSKFFMEIFNNYEQEQQEFLKNNNTSNSVNSNGDSNGSGDSSRKGSIFHSIKTKNRNCSQKQLVFCLSDSLKNFLKDDFHHHYAKIHSIVNHNSHFNHMHHHYNTHSLNHHMDTITNQQNEEIQNMNHNLDYEALKICIDYIYTSKLKVPSYLLPHVYTLAYHLSFENIVQACSQHLIQHLNVDNCLSIRSFALDEMLIQSSTECIEKNIEYILQINGNNNNNNNYHQLNGYSSVSTTSLNKLDLNVDVAERNSTVTSSINLGMLQFVRELIFKKNKSFFPDQKNSIEIQFINIYIPKLLRKIE